MHCLTPACSWCAAALGLVVSNLHNSHVAPCLAPHTDACQQCTACPQQASQPWLRATSVRTQGSSLCPCLTLCSGGRRTSGLQLARRRPQQLPRWLPHPATQPASSSSSSSSSSSRCKKTRRKRHGGWRPEPPAGTRPLRCRWRLARWQQALPRRLLGMRRRQRGRQQQRSEHSMSCAMCECRCYAVAAGRDNQWEKSWECV